MPSDRIELTTPVGRAWEPVVRMVLGGIADRLDLGFDELDDLQLAVERLLAEGDPQDPVTLSFELVERGVRTRVGPLRDTALAAAVARARSGKRDYPRQNRAEKRQEDDRRIHALSPSSS